MGDNDKDDDKEFPPFVEWKSNYGDCSFEMISIVGVVLVLLFATGTCLAAGLFQEQSIILFVVFPVGSIVILALIFSISHLKFGESDTISGNSSVPGSIFYVALLVATLAFGWLSLGLTWCVSVLYDTDGCLDTQKTQAVFSLATIAGFSIFLTGIFPSESTKWRKKEETDGKEVEPGRVVFQCQSRTDIYSTISGTLSAGFHLMGVIFYVVLLTICLGLTADWASEDGVVGYVFVGANSFSILIFGICKLLYHLTGENNKGLATAVLTLEMIVVGFTMIFWCVNCLRRIKFLTQVMACVRCDPKLCKIPCLDDLGKSEFEELCPHCIGQEFC